MTQIKKHISFPKISDFKSVIHAITHAARYLGVDEDNQVMYSTDPLPKLKFKGTVKLHGTNSGVSYNDTHGMWYQSRTNIITPTKDNAGFAFFTETNKEAFMSIINDIASVNDIDLSVYTLSVYGEWAGKGIQRGVGITELDKAFYLFGVKVSNPQDPDFNSYWLDSTPYQDVDNKIYNVDKFKTYEMEIDFNDPKLTVNDMIDITNAVEEECPVSKHFGVSGIGEGIVWRTEYKGTVQRFKIKGSKHSVTKVKKLVEVDVVKLNGINDFVDRTVTLNRVEQGIENTCTRPLDRKMLGGFLKWLVNDIIEEEGTVLAENNLEPKDVRSALSKRAVNMFMELYNNE